MTNTKHTRRIEGVMENIDIKPEATIYQLIDRCLCIAGRKCYANSAIDCDDYNEITRTEAAKLLIETRNTARNWTYGERLDKVTL